MYQPDSQVKGAVSVITRFGALVDIDGESERGILHISEMADHLQGGEVPRDFVDLYEVRVMRVIEDRLVGEALVARLSLRGLNDASNEEQGVK